MLKPSANSNGAIQMSQTISAKLVNKTFVRLYLRLEVNCLRHQKKVRLLSTSQTESKQQM